MGNCLACLKSEPDNDSTTNKHVLDNTVQTAPVVSAIGGDTVDRRGKFTIIAESLNDSI